MKAATFEGVSSSDRAAAHTRIHDRRSEPSREGGGGLSVATIAIASVASVVSAVVVSHVWGPGTLYGAAATPVIVAFVSEALRRPRTVTQRVIKTARARQTHAFDPLEEGRRGLQEGALVGDAPAVGTRPRADHRAGRLGVLSRRRALVLALVTGVLAFAVAAVALTGGELVFGRSAVGGVSSRTTLFGGAPAKQQQHGTGGQGQGEKTQQSTTTTGQGSTSTSVSPGTTSTSTTTAPSTGTTSPSPTAPQGVAPQGTTSAPSPAPAPPPQTTPTPTAP